MSSLDYGVANITPRYTGAETKRDSAQVISNNVATEVTYSGNVIDSDQLLSGSRLTIPQSGLWLTQALAEWQVNQFNGYRNVAIRQALGRTVSRGILNSDRKGPSTALAILSHAILALDPLLAGDQLFMEVQQTNGGVADQDLVGGMGYTPRLVAHRFTQPNRYVGAYLYGIADQAIIENAWTEVNLAVADFENGINWGVPSLAARRNGVPIRTAGVYLAIASMRWEQSAGLRGAGIYVTRPDGTISIPNSTTTNAADGAPTDQTVTAIVFCRPGDEITVRGFQLSGAGRNSQAVPSERKPNLRVLKLGELDPSRYALGEAKLTFAQAYTSFAQTVGGGVAAPLPCDKVLYDTDSLYVTEYVASAGYTVGKFVIRRRGTYLINANYAVTFNPVSDNMRIAIIRQSQNIGTEILARSLALQGGNGAENSINGVRLAELFPGDEIYAEYFDANNGRIINAADPNNLFRSSVTLVGLDSPQTQGSGRYNPGGQ